MQGVWYEKRFLSAFCIYLKNFGTFKGLSEINDWKRIWNWNASKELLKKMVCNFL